MVNMTNRGKEVIIEENEIDKISNFPTHILDEIFKDMEFFKELSVTTRLVEYGFSSMIDNILLRHIELIVKFYLDLSTIYSNDKDVDYWLLRVTSKCVKELTLKNHKCKCYTLPFCIFDCSTLTYLDVTNFMVKFPPSPRALFPNLLQLTLKFIIFFPNKVNYVLNTPLLSSLTFIACNGVHFLTISAPRIQFLTIRDSYDIRTSFFENLSNIRGLLMVLQVREESKTYEEERFITWPRLLYLCCNLQDLNIDDVAHYLKDPNCVDKQFEKLDFCGTKKLILAYSPSLSRMIVEPSDELDVAKVLVLYEQLRMPLKASPKVKVIVAIHGQ
ncbi:hypothetical protein H5410_027155, partial [Solanum commersonii]